ncbi:MAG: ATP-binding cassette domain-containing protein [Methanomicrobiales archaeon]|nr:ATP-binding cassette domain-containing protein [Methanomicrobiales archaeon]
MNAGGRKILKNISLNFEKGEIISLIGPSGAGKTTLLRIMDLLERPTSGSVFYSGVDTGGSEKERLTIRRKMAMVFQKPVALSGSVLQNVATGLRFRGIPRGETSERVNEALTTVGLGEYGARIASTLSGGELQRIALARALVTRPEVLLLDEPTANLDPLSSAHIERLIRVICRRWEVTVVMATHDMHQGQRLSDRVAVLIEGVLGQVGSPSEVFYTPSSKSVARLVGVENIMDGSVMHQEEGLAVISLHDGGTLQATSNYPVGTEVSAFLRPEEVTICIGSPGRVSALNEVTGNIVQMAYTGSIVRVEVATTPPLYAIITRRSVDDLGLREGMPVTCSFKASAVHVRPYDL